MSLKDSINRFIVKKKLAFRDMARNPGRVAATAGIMGTSGAGMFYLTNKTIDWANRTPRPGIQPATVNPGQMTR